MGKRRTVPEEEDADVVDGARVLELEDGVGVVDLLQVRLRQAARYEAAEHRVEESKGLVIRSG